MHIVPQAVYVYTRLVYSCNWFTNVFATTKLDNNLEFGIDNDKSGCLSEESDSKVEDPGTLYYPNMISFIHVLQKPVQTEVFTTATKRAIIRSSSWFARCKVTVLHNTQRARLHKFSSIRL